MFRQYSKHFFYIFLAVAAISFVIYAKSDGKIGRTIKTSDEGCACHGDLDKKVTVVIEGPETMNSGETAEFTVTITGGPLLNGGFNAAVSAGTLIAGEGTKLLKGELTHSEPKKPENGKLLFKFSYTAPDSAGDVTMFANGLSGNNNDNKSGDHWNYAANKTITVASAK